MVGSLESDIQSVNQRPDIDSVVNDFDDDNDEKDGPFESKQVSICLINIVIILF